MLTYYQGLSLSLSSYSAHQNSTTTLTRELPFKIPFFRRLPLSRAPVAFVFRSSGCRVCARVFIHGCTFSSSSSSFTIRHTHTRPKCSSIHLSLPLSEPRGGGEPSTKKERERRAKRCFLSNDFPFPTDSVCAAVDEASSSPPSHSLRFLSLCTVGYVGYAQGGENVVHQFFFLQKMDR